MRAAFEHITLDGEAEPEAAPVEPVQRQALKRYTLPGRPDGCQTIVSILEGQHLHVREVGPRGELRAFQFDARFADPEPVRLHHIPWAWLLAATGIGALGFGALAYAWPAIGAALGPDIAGMLIAIFTCAIAIGVGLRWTTESLLLQSAYGGAALVGVTTGVGGTRRYQQVFAELSRCVAAARLARPQEKPQFLRDAMREHYRLKQLGILSERQYEASKAAILAAH